MIYPRRWLTLALTFVVLGAATPAAARQATPSASPIAGIADASERGCTAGSSGIGDGYFPLMGNGGYDAQAYELDLDLDVRGAAVEAGRATIRAMATLPLCAFNLDFVGLEIDAVAVDGQPAAFSRRGQELTVVPAAPIARGATFEVSVDYHGAIAAIPASGDPRTPALPPADAAPGEPADPQVFGGLFAGEDLLFLAGEPSGADRLYPVNGHPADKATYTFRLTVDAPFAAAANGVLTERIPGDGEETFVWTARDPMASYLVTIHAAELDLVDAVAPDGLQLRYAFARATAPEQRRVFEVLTPRMHAFFAERFGPYPFEVSGATVVDAPIFFALETQTMSLFARIPTGFGPIPPEALQQQAEILAHELAHQWFGDSVSPLRWEGIWLNEGFAAYGAYLWIEETEGRAEFERRLAASYESVVAQTRFFDPAARAGATAVDLLAALGVPVDQIDADLLAVFGVDTVDELRALPFAEALTTLESFGIPGDFFATDAVLTGDPGPSNLFSSAFVYERGALALHALRLEVGDEAFFAILRAWTDRFRNGNATVADFAALSEEVSGQELTAFFNAWLFSPELPPLALGGEAGATPAPATPEP